MTAAANFRKKDRTPTQSTALPISGKEIVRFRQALLAWYDANRRDLPWRRTRDPYAIWLSEIMLQQTRVTAVLEHYRNFLEQFPNVEALAAASEDEVLAAWSGLGYYRRARMLHRCAKKVVDEYGGRFPESEEASRGLPGIGRYTAAAIASIAFDEPVAVVDGNVERVVGRLDGRDFAEDEVWERAQQLLAAGPPNDRPGDFNQAMMELGATICLPRGPRCLACPVVKWCASRGERPSARPPSRQRKREIWCVLDRRNGRLRLVQRPRTDSLMAGMWELPQRDAAPNGNALLPWRTFRHSITVTDYTVHVLRGPSAKPSSKPSSKRGTASAHGKWVAVERIPQLPITGLTRKILKADGII